VRLWDAENQVVVEVQRGRGCSFAFHQLAKNVLRASKGLNAAPSAKPRFVIPDCIPLGTEEERQECLKEGLEIAVSLLQKDAIDSRVMALESLVHLTKVCRCKGLAAETILGNKDILRSLISLVEDSSTANDANQMSLSALEEHNVSVMRHQAMTVLANCFDSLKEHEKLHRMLNLHHETLLCDSLICALIDQVSNADERPHEACQACRCLQALTDASVATRRRALELNAQAIVSKAYEEGLCRHAQLEDLSSKLQLSMNAAADNHR
jgi:hypothetical protein